MTEDIPFANRFVAGPNTRRDVARASMSYSLHRKVLWVAPLVSVLPFSLLLFSGMDSEYSLSFRLFWAPIFALVPALLLAAMLTPLIAILSYRITLKGSKARLYEGAVLETGFGEDEWVSRTPLAAARTSYRAIKGVSVRGQFVFLRIHGLAQAVMWPRELFPDPAIQHIQRKVEFAAFTD